MNENKDMFIPKMDEQTTKQNTELTRKERRWFIWGAIKSSLLIGAAYAIGFGILILIMYLCFLKK